MNPASSSRLYRVIERRLNVVSWHAALRRGVAALLVGAFGGIVGLCVRQRSRSTATGARLVLRIAPVAATTIAAIVVATSTAR